jgi:hypothetical protein
MLVSRLVPGESQQVKVNTGTGEKTLPAAGKKTGKRSTKWRFAAETDLIRW